MALQNALSAFPPHNTFHAKILLAKTMGSVEALNYATWSLAIPFDASPLKEIPVSSRTLASPPKPASISSPLPKPDKPSADPSFVHQPYVPPTEKMVDEPLPSPFAPIPTLPRRSDCKTSLQAAAQKEGSSSRSPHDVMTLDARTPISSLSRKTSSLLRQGSHCKSTPPSTAATPSLQEPRDEPLQSPLTDTAKSPQMNLGQASLLTGPQSAETTARPRRQQAQSVHVDDLMHLQIPETPLVPPQSTCALPTPHDEVTLIPESLIPDSLPDPEPTHSPRSLPASPRSDPIAHCTRANSSPPEKQTKRNKVTACSKLLLSPNANVYSSIVQHVASCISNEPSKQSLGIPRKGHGRKANSSNQFLCRRGPFPPHYGPQFRHWDPLC